MCCQTNKHCDRDCTADQQGKASENKKKYFLECLHLAGIFLQWRKSWRSGMALAVNLVSGYSCCLPSVVRFRIASRNIPWRSASLSRWTIAGGIYFLANVPRQVSLAGGAGGSQGLGAKALGLHFCQQALCLSA